jgi:beta-glucanase (GH16 family)
MLGSNIDKVGWPKCERLIFLSMWGENQILFLLHTHRTVMEIQSTQKTRIEDIEEGYHIYAMDWSKDKIDFLLIII